MQNHYIEGLTVLASECFAVTTLTKDLLIEEYVIAGVSFYYCIVFTLKYWAASSELCDELVQNELKKNSQKIMKSCISHILVIGVASFHQRLL